MKQNHDKFVLTNIDKANLIVALVNSFFYKKYFWKNFYKHEWDILKNENIIIKLTIKLNINIYST